MIEQGGRPGGRAGDWKRAAAILTGLARNPDLPMPTRYSQAVACLKAGDAAGYRAASRRHGRASAAGRPENVPPRFDQSSQRGVPWPERDRRLDQNAGLDRSSPGPAGGDREGGQPGPPGTGPNGATEVLARRGAVLFRAGRFEEAAKVLRQAISLHPDSGAFEDWLFLALAEHRLGHTKDATEAASRARALIPKSRSGSAWDRAEVKVLADELNTALPLSRK